MPRVVTTRGKAFCHFPLAFSGAAFGEGIVVNASGFAVNPFRTGRIHPIFSAATAIFAISAFATSNVVWFFVIPRVVFFVVRSVVAA